MCYCFIIIIIIIIIYYSNLRFALVVCLLFQCFTHNKGAFTLWAFGIINVNVCGKFFLGVNDHFILSFLNGVEYGYRVTMGSNKNILFLHAVIFR